MNNATLENQGSGPSFTGTIRTIGFTDCFFTNGTVEISLESGLTLTRRIRIRDSSFHVASGNTGINFSTQATVPVEGYALQFVNFSGDGTYLQGYGYQDDVSRFSECRGIVNTSRLGQMILTGNTTSTTVNQTDTYYKVEGATVEGGKNQRFSHTGSGRLSYISNLTQNFMISCTASLSAGSNQEIDLAVFRNGSFIQGSEVTGTTGSGGRSEGLASQALVTLNLNDYVEVFVKNGSSSTDITVEDFNFIIREI